MIYRILATPPGYSPECNYMVAAYETLEYDSSVGWVRGPDGKRFTATLEEARSLLPANARRLAFAPEHQFLEVWESEEGAAAGKRFRPDSSNNQAQPPTSTAAGT
jgi:hypothetical protein